MVVKLIWDGTDGGQSDVYQVGKDGKIAQKVYFGIEIKDLILYLKTQKKLSEKNPYIIKLEKEEELDIGNGKKIKEIHFDILDLNTEIFESTSIENKTSMFSSEQKFIEGKTLKDFLSTQEREKGIIKTFIKKIEKIISSTIYRLSLINSKIYIGYELSDENQIHSNNIKVNSYDDKKGILYLTITDIAKLIRDFIKVNSERIEYLLNE